MIGSSTYGAPFHILNGITPFRGVGEILELLIVVESFCRYLLVILRRFVCMFFHFAIATNVSGHCRSIGSSLWQLSSFWTFSGKMTSLGTDVAYESSLTLALGLSMAPRLRAMSR